MAQGSGGLRDGRRVRVLAIADTDSYLKWSVATLRAMPASWDTSAVLLASPVSPSAAQVRAAGASEVPTLHAARLLTSLRRQRPDVVLLACTGPVVEVLTGLPGLSRGRRRPVLVTGLPGLHVAPTWRALRRRARCDLLLAHSHAEVEELTKLAAADAPGLVIGLGRLPFLPTGSGTSDGTDVVFAAQARVPAARGERESVLRALAALEPAGCAVVKLRAGPGEQQTHHETWPYPTLWRDLVRRGEVEADRVRFVAGSMADALSTARVLVTVSSTAALEAMAHGVPVAVLTDFGVSAELLNAVFTGSGCLASLDDVREGRWHRADPAWLRRHYLHPAAEEDWLVQLEALVARRSAVGLPRRVFRPSGSRWSSARGWARVLLPGWARRRLGPPARGRRARGPRPDRRAG